MELYDVAISFDTTGSMSSCIANVKKNMREMMRKLKSDIPGIRLAVIAHGDYDTDHAYIIKHADFTDNVDRLSLFVGSASGTGGGHMRNLDEAYELSLNYCRRLLSWRDNSNRILVMIGDCRPHERNYPLNTQRIDWMDECRMLREKDVKIYAVQCLQRNYADSFYQTIAAETFGHHVTLTHFSQIEEILMTVCYREAGLISSTATPGPSTIITAGIKVAEKVEDNVLHKGTVVISDSEDDSDSDDDQLGLVCTICHVGKLPNEFPPCPLTEECRHPHMACMRCTIRYVEEQESCPHPSCNAVVGSQSMAMKLYQAVLDRMFTDYGKILEQNKLASRPEGDVVGVSTINGDTEWFTYRSNMTISALKSAIEVRLKLRPEQQKLIFNDESLKKNSSLGECGIKPYDTISLILPLYCVPEELDHVIFDLNWEFPAINPDFLDASCMAFERDKFVQVIDWNHPKNDYFLKGSIRHSEKNMTGPGSKTGHQIIHVYLKKVPANITHLYFTLSSWKSPDLSSFKNPNLKFFDAADENVNLCETTFTHALHSQAVIMCSVVRTGRYWQIFECHGTSGLVNGNSKKYNPIRKKIVDLIKEDL